MIKQRVTGTLIIHLEGVAAIIIVGTVVVVAAAYAIFPAHISFVAGCAIFLAGAFRDIFAVYDAAPVIPYQVTTRIAIVRALVASEACCDISGFKGWKTGGVVTNYMVGAHKTEGRSVLGTLISAIFRKAIIADKVVILQAVMAGQTINLRTAFEFPAVFTVGIVPTEFADKWSGVTCGEKWVCGGIAIPILAFHVYQHACDRIKNVIIAIEGVAVRIEFNSVATNICLVATDTAVIAVAVPVIFH